MSPWVRHPLGASGPGVPRAAASAGSLAGHKARSGVREAPADWARPLARPAGVPPGTVGDSVAAGTPPPSKAACVGLLCRSLAHLELLLPLVSAARARVRSGRGAWGLR